MKLSSLRPDVCDAVVFVVIFVALLLARCVDAPPPELEAPAQPAANTRVALATEVRP